MDYTHLWPLFALFAAWFGGAQLLVNGHMKVPGHVVMLWRSLTSVLVLLPVAVLTVWPSDPRFYLYTVLAGILALFTGMGMYNAAAKFGAPVISRLMPGSISISFVAWYVFYPADFMAAITHPYWFAGTVALLLLTMFTLANLRHCVVTWAATLFMLPVIGIQGINSVFQKSAQLYVPLTTGPLQYVFLIGVVTFLGAVGMNLAHHKKDMLRTLKHPHHWRGGLIIGVLYLLYLSTQTVSAALAPNPAYMIAIAMSAPVWVHLYERARGRKEQADTKAGFLFVASAVALAVVVALRP